MTCQYHFIVKLSALKNHAKSQYHNDIILLNIHTYQLISHKNVQVQALISHVVSKFCHQKSVCTFLPSNLYQVVVKVFVFQSYQVVQNL